MENDKKDLKSEHYIAKEKSIPKKNKSLARILLENNPFDKIADLSRDFMGKLGVLEIFDDFIYWNVGRANFIRIFKLFWKYPITGKSNFPSKGGAIVISNHQSELDPWLVGSAVDRKVQWLSKKENFDIPIFKSIIKPFGTIPIKRGQHDIGALEKVKAVLESGGCVGMFPEGTRSPDGELGYFHSGAAKLCIETGVPYVPCAIFGAYDVFPKHASLNQIKIRDGSVIKVTIGKPVYIDSSMELNYDNIQKVKEEMRKDVLLLKAGKMNKSRIISETSMIYIQGEQIPIENRIPENSTIQKGEEKISELNKDFGFS
ncbi:MAG: lysophospholipid acyltransferase family protein [Promethearchaeota archaeon]